MKIEPCIVDTPKIYAGDTMIDKRVCGTCGEAKPLCEFYKDGKDKEGNIKYRRDCKECYRVTRLRARNMKRQIGGRTKR